MLEKSELSVNELQEITRLSQSRISTHLALLQDSGLVQSRREGKRAFYKLSEDSDGSVAEFLKLAFQGAGRIAGAFRGPDQPEAHPEAAAGAGHRFISTRWPEGSIVCTGPAGPGRDSGICCCASLPPLVVADLGSGEGLLSELLARRCKKVIAVDNSEKIVAFGAAKARKNGLKNLEFRLGDLQNPPIESR